MKRSSFVCKCLFLLIFSSFFVFTAACSKQDSAGKVESMPDLTITQTDIMLLLEHKKAIDSITAEYDKKIAAVTPGAAYKLIEEGKTEINRYLESKGLNPEVFMKKSKKILRCYLAFEEISDETMQKRIEILKRNDASPKDIETKIQVYKKAGESFFKEMTSELSQKEIDLIKSNLKNIASVTEKSE